ncbi:MAG: T9SS type A sorting domain-containing protein [Flavobacterium sp.]|nr:T9SS type A sorting domain-containing protein [Flavobacterium sp.]
MQRFKLFLLLFFIYFKSFSQYTAIPDMEFEQYLINNAIDTQALPDGQVLTADIVNVTDLHLTNINSLIGIEGFVALTSLAITWSQLTTIDLSNNINLLNLDINYNFYLQSLNISNNINLIGIECYENQLTHLDLSNNINLIQILCHRNQLTSLDVSNNLNLLALIAWDNNLSQLDVSNNTLLSILDVSSNNISSLDVSQNTMLGSLGCSNNLLTHLDLTNNANLNELWCNNNQITTLEINSNSFYAIPSQSNNFTIPVFNCSNNNLSQLTIQNGNNISLNGIVTYIQGTVVYKRFNAKNNPNLTCIYVDDVVNCNANWTEIDATTHFVNNTADCQNLSDSDFVNNQFNISPNPTSDNVVINFGVFQEKVNITLYNILDQFVSSQELQNIALTSYPIIGEKGIYFLKIENQKGTTKTYKIIKD